MPQENSKHLSKFKRKVLLITLEPISERMAGPAIRCLEMGRELADEFDVTIYSPQTSNLFSKDVETTSFKVIAEAKRSILERLVGESEIVVIQANVMKSFPFIAKLARHLVVDLYDPYLFTIQVQYESDSATASASFRMMHQVLEKHMLAADFAICASERQRDYWIGRFCALGRLDPNLYKFDRSLRKLIDVVPFGLPDCAPIRSGPGLRNVIPEIADGDPLLIWGGGIWDWFDPLTIISAVTQLSSTISNIRLVFMGTKSPNPQVPLMEMATKAQNLSQSLGMTNKHIFFPDTWVSYDKRANYLLDADIAVSAHFDLPETRYSFRTRMLDYFWTHLPIISSGGDSLSDLIDRQPAGLAVPYENVDAWKQAITKMLADRKFKDTCAQGSAELARLFTWTKVVEPLRKYCRNPYRLPGYRPVSMPSLFERAQAVYSRGGKDLVIKRSSELLKDLLP